MKLANLERDVQTYGLGETKGFEIKATAKAFEILSSGLYKDKITAILREISANALDAHKAKGCEDRPFKVHLPSTMNPYLSIRDFGEGLSHPLMLKLYQTYFGSLKEETNDLIGGLGLGSKSPFAYTDSYTVVSRQNGEKRTYDLYRDENGEPQIALRATEQTDEEDGLEVIVPLTNNYDTREFQTKARSVYEFYPVPPHFSGSPIGDIVSHTTIMEGKGWRITDRMNGYNSGTARAIMGVIAYPIDRDTAISIEEANASKDYDVARRILQAPIDIEFNIGDLDITAGREELSYVKTTKAKLRERLLEISNELNASIAEQFKLCKNMLDAKKLYGKLFGHGSKLSMALGNDHEVRFRGMIISDTVFDINMEDFPKTKLVNYIDSKRGGHKFTKDYKAPPVSPAGTSHYRDERDYKLRIDAMDRRITEFFIDDLGGVGHHSSRIFHYRLNSHPRPNVVLIQTEGQRDLNRLKKLLDGIEFRNVSELPKPSYSRSYTKTKLKILGLRAYNQDSFLGPKDGPWDETDVTVETGGIFVVTNRGKIMKDNAENHDSEFAKTFAVARKLNLISTDEEIVAVPLSMVKQFTNMKKYEGKWVNFFDLVVERGEAVLTPEIQSKIAIGRSHSNFTNPCGRDSLWHAVLTGLAEKLPESHPIVQFKSLYDATNGHEWYNYQTLADQINFRFECEADDLNKIWKDAVSPYPMLRFVFPDFSAANYLDDMIHYIELIDNNNG